ncbi:MAG TPA: RNA polymerase sigma factor [Candidatus Dojkabacteria bacterium]|nr:RNA polymerase sigma factor [Candidatus Dojkabacteria bacterium]
MNKAKLESQKDLEDIFTALNRQIYSYVFLRTGYSKEIAEDLTQEVFLRVWEKRKGFNSKRGNIKTWVYRIARNLVIDEYRKKKDILNLNNYEGEGRGIEEETMINEMQSYVLKKLTKLTDSEQELISLYYIEELEVKEVAEIVNKSYDATKMAINRALHKLKDLCNE